MLKFTLSSSNWLHIKLILVRIIGLPILLTTLALVRLVQRASLGKMSVSF